ncbi:transporter substrate-binding domain-containing protein [Bacillus sp. JJ722]|uniref:transporter substrate-binding domain-containing protein n=1 Tax=Bacillus sp. JJ722 TaxID=3122973 RepID=UPI002FFD5E7C
MMRNILRISCYISFFLLIQIVWPPEGSAEKKTYKVAGDSVLPPFSYTNENGKLTGISIDLMEQVSKNSNLDFEYIPMSIQEAEQALQKGKIDAIAGTSYSLEKDRIFDFSIPYFTMSDSIIIPKESVGTIRGIADVRNYHVALEDGTFALDTMLNMRNTNLTLTTNQFTALKALLNGKAEVFVGNKWTAAFYLQYFNQDRNFIILDDVMNTADYAIAVKNGNEELLSVINESLNTLQAKGEVNALVDEWIRPQRQAEIARLEYFVSLLLIGISFAALVVLIIYIINKRLQKAVSLQTGKLTQLNEDLQQQQQRAADSNAFKEQILNNIDTGIVTLDIDLKITSCNAQALEMLQLNNILPLDLQYSYLLEQLLQHYNLEHSEKEYSVSRVLEVTQNGSKQVIYYRMLEMFDSQQQQTGYLLSMNDETEKKNLEQKLITQEKLHALGQLVAGVAHEIRNPLTSIKAFIDMLPSKYDRPKFREVIIEHLPAEVNRLNMIVTDLVDYARPRPPNKQQYSANELTSLLTFLQVTIDKKRITLEQSLNHNLVFYIDPQQIRQVLLNLLLNAIDAVEDAEEKRITISLETAEEGMGEIMISDTGKGMKPEELNHIFEPFYTSKEKGVGLGLTLSYNLVKENNGDIQVSSQPNQGTVFTVKLPLCQKEL